MVVVVVVVVVAGVKLNACQHTQIQRKLKRAKTRTGNTGARATPLPLYLSQDSDRGKKKKTSLRSSWITVRFTNSYANTNPANVEDVVVCKRGGGHARCTISSKVGAEHLHRRCKSRGLISRVMGYTRLTATSSTSNSMAGVRRL